MKFGVFVMRQVPFLSHNSHSNTIYEDITMFKKTAFILIAALTISLILPCTEDAFAKKSKNNTTSETPAETVSQSGDVTETKTDSQSGDATAPETDSQSGDVTEPATDDAAAPSDEPGLNFTKKVLYVDRTFDLKLNGAEGKIKWSSSDKKIATVSKGHVTGVSAGYVYIYAECEGVKYECLVKVKAAGLTTTTKRIRKGNSFKLKLKGTKAVSFSSSAPKIAKVDENGTVTARKKGNAVISCLCENGETYTCDVEVYLNILDIENPTFSDLAPTVNMSFEELVGDNGIYDELTAMPEAGTYKIIVDLYHKVVMAYTKDDDGKYTRPVRYMLCGVGASSTPTPTGTFKMENYRLRYEHFNNTNCYGQYWSILTGRIYFHSILYTSFNAKDYTDTSYDNLGKSVSHGCIRLTVPDARWIYYNVAPGTVVVVRKGSADDKDTAAIREQLVLAERPKKRPNLVMGEIPDTDNWTIDEVAHETEFIQGSQNGGEAAL